MVVPCGGLQSLPVHSFNALIIPILRGCLQSLFKGRIWDLIVSVPDHCLSFYFFSRDMAPTLIDSCLPAFQVTKLKLT